MADKQTAIAVSVVYATPTEQKIVGAHTTRRPKIGRMFIKLYYVLLTLLLVLALLLKHTIVL